MSTPISVIDITNPVALDLPLDIGALQMAQTLESLGLLMIGLAKNGAGTFDIAIPVDIGLTR